jgi:hypothetical protein
MAVLSRPGSDPYAVTSTDAQRFDPLPIHRIVNSALENQRLAQY